MVKNKITKDTTIMEALEINEKAGETLFMKGLGCVGCAMAGTETIEQGCLAHGMDKKDIDKLVRELNKK
jgi:hybrid cluster-associated redox disulfide protein